jgi:hypothetical protein
MLNVCIVGAVVVPAEASTRTIKHFSFCFFLLFCAKSVLPLCCVFY